VLTSTFLVNNTGYGERVSTSGWEDDRTGSSKRFCYRKIVYMLKGPSRQCRTGLKNTLRNLKDFLGKRHRRVSPGVILSVSSLHLITFFRNSAGRIVILFEKKGGVGNGFDCDNSMASKV
jgi:hypothetical protein